MRCSCIILSKGTPHGFLRWRGALHSVVNLTRSLALIVSIALYTNRLGLNPFPGMSVTEFVSPSNDASITSCGVRPNMGGATACPRPVLPLPYSGDAHRSNYCHPFTLDNCTC